MNNVFDSATTVLLLGLATSVLAGCGSDQADNPSSTGSTGGAAGSATAGSGGAGGTAAGGAAGSAAGGASAGGGTGGTASGGGLSGLGGTPQRPLLSSDQAADYTVLKYLAQAGNVAALVTDDWDPTAGLGAIADFTADYNVAASGGTHTTVQAAIDAAVADGGTDRIYVAVAPDTYPEVVCVPAGAPLITLYGTGADASETVIVFDNYSGKPKNSGEPANPCNPSLSSTTYGTSGSATFAAFANGFQAKNLTIANDTDESVVSDGKQAVALLTQADQVVLENVRLLGNQDTFYAKTNDTATVTRTYVKDSYVEGDVDFIFGRATIVLDGCTIQYLSSRQSGGELVAPSTDSRNAYGILINASELTAEAGTAPNSTYLGRAWDESQGDLAGYATNVATGIYPNGQALVQGSTLGPHIRGETPWNSAATTSRPFSSVDGTYPANRLYEFGNTGP